MSVRNLVIFVLIALSGCNGGKKNDAPDMVSGQIVISGQLEHGDDQLVTLDLMGATAFIPVDSARCDEDGNFTLVSDEPGLNFYALKYTVQGYVTLVAAPGDHIEIEGIADTLYPYSVKGSAASELLRQLAVAHKQTLDQLEEISEHSRNLAPGEDYAFKKQELNQRFDSITNAFHRYSEHFIRDHPNSPAILVALYNQYGPGLPVFHPLTDLDIYLFADSVLFENFPDKEAVKSLHSELSAAMQQLRNQQENEQLQPGDKAPDFVIPGLNGEPVSLSDFRGRYVLLNFWASWSKPSVDENRFLAECLRKFGDRNFTILSVSIDDDREEWKNAVHEEMDDWYHVSELQRWESVVANLFRIERIPANFLIDPKGTIIEKDNFGENLVQTIQKYVE